VKFFLNLIPPTSTAQMKKVRFQFGHPVIYTPKKIQLIKKDLISHLEEYKPETPYLGALALRIWWVFPVHNYSHKHLEWRTTRPDTDNLEKLLKDCMTEAGFWKDDSLVVKEIVSKYWSRKEYGIGIEILELGKFVEQEELYG